jgi:subtilisin family serine protease
MKRSIFLLVLCSQFCSISVCAQKDFYYYRGQKINIQRDETKICVITPKTETAVFTTAKGIEQKNIFDNQYNIVVYSTNDVTTARSLNQALTTSINKATSFTLPCYKTMSGEGLNMTPYLYVKLKKEEDYAILKEQAAQNSLIIVSQNEFMPLWYTLLLTPQSVGNTLEIANGLYETELFAAAAPDFSFSETDELSYDPLFYAQWGLFNTTNREIDIHISAAWPYATGKDIKLAILDTGIELTHSDLADNIYDSFDTRKNQSPSAVYHKHGTLCAGVAAAVNNNGTHIAGVAPDAKILSISSRLFNTSTDIGQRANGINWARKNGADIISCSWSAGTFSELLEEAIDSMIERGRNNKGGIVVFAAGNTYGDSVEYPGRYRPEILTVGAIDKYGEIANFSAIGNEIDVVAPGKDVLSTTLNNSTAYADGTSFATPHVAGLAALILERNPNLTGQQVRNIIEQNTIKIDNFHHPYTSVSDRPNGTWNQYMDMG